VPNTEWSAFYSGHAEIQDYFMRFFKKYQLEPFVKLEHEVLSAAWDESNGTCKISQTAKTVA
jgi:cation diffusion facilitator CzcD-associated flavoprotein CzcO